MQEISIAVVCAITVAGVLVYTLFSKPKALKSKKLSTKKTFLNTEVTWGGEDVETVYEELRNTKNRPIFKGNHKIN